MLIFYFQFISSAHNSIMLPGANKHSTNNSQQTRQHNPILCSIQLLKSPHSSSPAFSASSVELEQSVPSFGPQTHFRWLKHIRKEHFHVIILAAAYISVSCIRIFRENVESRTDGCMAWITLQLLHRHQLCTSGILALWGKMYSFTIFDKH